MSAPALPSHHFPTKAGRCIFSDMRCRAATCMLLAVWAAAQSPSANGPVRLTGKVVVRSFDVAKYPAAAQNQKIQGRVVLDVVISPKGKVERTVPISGDPLLATAVSDISKKWSFEPYNQ